MAVVVFTSSTPRLLYQVYLPGYVTRAHTSRRALLMMMMMMMLAFTYEFSTSDLRVLVLSMVI